RLEEIENSFNFEGCRVFSYFDNLLWQGDRVKDLFGFERALEIYIKPEKRRFGYFTLPILYGDRFVGRLDPKLDRKKKILLIRGLWLENGFKPDETYQDKFEKMLMDFAAFNGADKIEYPIA
ncbi:MAG: winged helix DNA-binding domain-containing protein, partial [Candidatus Bathyarchaeota archaeon]|nr:winged helix DNA-binding domain-containing protein [Candidatus Bathyarchaeota archaeon]